MWPFGEADSEAETSTGPPTAAEAPTACQARAIARDIRSQSEPPELETAALLHPTGSRTPSQRLRAHAARGSPSPSPNHLVHQDPFPFDPAMAIDSASLAAINEVAVKAATENFQQNQRRTTRPSSKQPFRQQLQASKRTGRLTCSPSTLKYGYMDQSRIISQALPRSRQISSQIYSLVKQLVS